VTAFPRLFSPIAIRGVEIKNRLFSPGHNTALSDRGLVSDAMVAYHEARARGGAGLIVTEVQTVHPTYMPEGRLCAARDDCIPGLRRLAAMGRSHGCRVFGQLYHPGRVAAASEDGSRLPGYAPSEVPDEVYKVVPRPLTRALIRDIVAAFGDAGRRMAEAGLDGAEVIGSMGYLIPQFLNPRLNRRADEYGGGLENRLRFAREIAADARAKAGSAFVLGLRISADEMDEDGLTAAEIREICAALDASGTFDYVNLTNCTTASVAGWQHIVPDMHLAHAYVAELAAPIKRAATRPVMVVGRVNQPQQAEAILEQGAADMVGMVRGLICDPDLPAKTRAGRLDDIRACIGCNQACIGHRLRGFPISCIQHPETGRELRYGTRKPPARRRRVMVVGGGPGGMKAAAVAAERGHEVTLYERTRRLGGQALLAQLLPGRAEFGGIVGNLAREVELAGVRVVLGREVDEAFVRHEEPEAIVVATGAQPRVPPLDLGEAHVADAWSVLRGEANVGGRVVVADWRCDWIGLGIAEKLARDGCRVRLCVTGPVAGGELPMMVRDTAMANLHRLGVEVIPYARLAGADSTTVYFQHMASREPVICEDVDTLVLASHHARAGALLDALEGWPGEVVAIGDCLSVRTAEEAVLEGLKAGSDL
jgi:2,4-dienoyl-CoA reductase-like NADH-dependent reductase (Old Yellow Enzyme family)